MLPTGPCHCPTEDVRCRNNTQSQTWHGTDNSAMIRRLECSHRPVAGISMGCSGRHLLDRLVVRPPHMCVRVCAVYVHLSIESRHTFDTDTSDSTCARLGYRKSVSRAS